jgi:hypothetical protein
MEWIIMNDMIMPKDGFLWVKLSSKKSLKYHAIRTESVGLKGGIYTFGLIRPSFSICGRSFYHQEIINGVSNPPGDGKCKECITRACGREHV